MMHGALSRLCLSALRRSRFAWRVNFSARTRIGDGIVRVPVLFGCGLQHATAKEPWLDAMLGRLLGESTGAFVDVGANVGQTLLKLRAIDPDREYVGFEPNPQCCHYLQELIRQNGFGRCTVVPVALADRTAIRMLRSRADADPSASIVDGFRTPERYSRAVPVPAFEGDRVLRDLAVRRIAAIKIDVEGGELDVLHGLARTIDRDRPHIVCEILPTYDPATPTGRLRLHRQRALVGLMSDLGYTLNRIGADGRLQPTDDIEIHADLSRCNYLFAPPPAAAGRYRTVNVATTGL